MSSAQKTPARTAVDSARAGPEAWRIVRKGRE
jgi:hypothetical protein